MLILLSVLFGTLIGDRVGGFFGSFVAALISIPAAGALQVIARELWLVTAQPGPPDGEHTAAPGLRPATRTQARSTARLAAKSMMG